jgi:hypothetical protein
MRGRGFEEFLRGAIDRIGTPEFLRTLVPKPNADQRFGVIPGPCRVIGQSLHELWGAERGRAGRPRAGQAQEAARAPVPLAGGVSAEERERRAGQRLSDLLSDASDGALDLRLPAPEPLEMPAPAPLRRDRPELRLRLLPPQARSALRRGLKRAASTRRRPSSAAPARVGHLHVAVPIRRAVPLGRAPDLRIAILGFSLDRALQVTSAQHLARVLALGPVYISDRGHRIGASELAWGVFRRAEGIGVPKSILRAAVER